MWPLPGDQRPNPTAAVGSAGKKSCKVHDKVGRHRRAFSRKEGASEQWCALDTTVLLRSDRHSTSRRYSQNLERPTNGVELAGPPSRLLERIMHILATPLGRWIMGEKISS